MGIARICLAFTWACFAVAQTGPSPSERLLAPHGIQHFSPLYRAAVDALFTAWPAYRRGDYQASSHIVDAFWKLHPIGGKEWDQAQSEGERIARTVNVAYGDPPCYYALRMLTECVAFRLKPPAPRPSIPALRFTVVMVGKSHGIEPSTIEELHEQRGQMAHHTFDPRFTESADAIVDQAFGLFFEYIHAITGGRLSVETRIVPLPDLDVPMRVFDDPGGQPSAELVPGALDRIWGALDEELKSSTDWWDILYPSHRPEQYPGFDHTDFSSGGGTNLRAGTNSIFLVGDERVLVLKAPKYGGKPYAPEERFAFFEQVMQHEFFHDFFQLYPQFKLEQRGHQWFDRSAWPADFEGINEADYFAEAMSKRILPQGNPPLWVKLRYAMPLETLSKLAPADFLGGYRREPATNGWHIGAISQDTALRWINDVGKSWLLFPSAGKRSLLTSPENPYFQTAAGRDFRISLRRDADGAFLPEVSGFWFNNEFYQKLPSPPK